MGVCGGVFVMGVCEGVFGRGCFVKEPCDVGCGDKRVYW